MKGRIFELDQIRRSAELGIGVKSAQEIELTPFGEESRDAADRIENILKSQG